ncbi:hypothetical protein ES332_D04G016600v1 [Gossypium tomentosum]|uniref:Uncharacterized protein n=1 Tax=Gossypium tomentosum TaxID=34277 RepID=A0A5D2L8F0_GOSTO|nr:hypothetical protein ES332_D04G016600v1 [Gossypium tomentosum]
MDSTEILSIFSFLLLFLQSHARPPVESSLPSGPSSPAPAPGPSNHGCWLSSTSCHNESLRACLDPASIAKVGGNSTIEIDAGELRCAIHIGAAASSSGIFNYIPFPRHISPIYLVILTGLIIGSTYACYKRSKRDDGIAYQQLEMGQPVSSSPNNVDVETAQGWEQDWDGEWQEVKSKLASVNGLSSRSAKRDDD